MIGTIEDACVLEYLLHIGDELISVTVTRVGKIRVRFGRIGGLDFLFDSGKVHGVSDDSGIVGDAMGNGIDWSEKRNRVLALF